MTDDSSLTLEIVINGSTCAFDASLVLASTASAGQRGTRYPGSLVCVITNLIQEHHFPAFANFLDVQSWRVGAGFRQEERQGNDRTLRGAQTTLDHTLLRQQTCIACHASSAGCDDVQRARARARLGALVPPADTCL